MRENGGVPRWEVVGSQKRVNKCGCSGFRTKDGSMSRMKAKGCRQVEECVKTSFGQMI